MESAINKTITIPKIAFKQIELSTNTLITILFLLLTFFIGYVNTTLSNRMDRLETKMDKLETKMDTNRQELEAKIDANYEKLNNKIVDIEKQNINMKRDVKEILNILQK